MADRMGQPLVDSQLAEFFIRDARKAASIMEAIYINKCRRVDDISMFIINVHAMKSALANVGEEELSARASDLENAGRDKDVKFILSELPLFLESLYAVIYKFEEREEKQRVVKTELKGDNSLLKEKLQGIRAACSVYNKKTAKDLLAELKEKSWPAETEEALSAIAGFLLHSEFDDAARIIEDYTKQI
jgi:HPt (histidine-containing phosphotransfer) domain-containing protein